MTNSASEAAAAAATSSVTVGNLRGAGVRDAQQLDRARLAHRRDGLGEGRQFAQGDRMPRQGQVGRHRKAGIAGAQHRYVRSHSFLPPPHDRTTKPTAQLSTRWSRDGVKSARQRV